MDCVRVTLLQELNHGIKRHSNLYRDVWIFLYYVHLFFGYALESESCIKLKPYSKGTGHEPLVSTSGN